MIRLGTKEVRCAAMKPKIPNMGIKVKLRVTPTIELMRVIFRCNRVFP